ncbi:bifunctional 1-(5-phosphoribosyl)-5-((5-phosphoribosylamino)methylideneamino)imidazole-4-carboxamide isomerase/phosphoribosylanthranilate isomerase PriA [Tessaracoccus palaemonis]|uniref:1-(5-phosphoribosyl)-5-[(5-phosphoribosylamino)methylideneamino] imidazole-4-carboxamide isomerase n=1 Tax=Tessaracoccus palaemonis TaxID=2829499 RepID=A0ABX8SP03_9ACTN|nr:bifunctional 1-(5-phosphoribosyl)-5-((5-phosphoribosylamino)methylideneamino)imidazole-4-carboxamide isomerase/phosphoribosylanthranilate isomerase PriA [Tessaracoccus palaemonis]QXT64125.1 bifunctional 1-(5-phosphoribosyl)-5-((5-phosphoribosylamino)methylideneamino)imidazole-4-carboxamide isomerase/phosphoribosylanthranilate isomerase PriA [Tessaracoccus palaemonis]
MEKLQLLPAVDVQGGQAVQLVQGVAGTQKEFGDPLAAALRWQEGGASWLHLVDLDAAFGRGSNADLLRDIVGHLDLNVELSGGIRDDETLERALSTGARRVNIGTAALENPQWCDRVVGTYGDRVAIGLDVRGENLAARGWTTEGGPWMETLDRLVAAGCERFVVTDVNSDGMLTGPNTELLTAVARRSGRKVIASGGIATLDNLRDLRALVDDGIEGAIIGTALYVGRFTLADALAVAEGDA